uniref:DEFENSIN domain-containing protein n=1 Tax=Haemonchus contortus TaxID=6289 RepID=A0A7I4YWQ6_HAECO
MSLAALVLVVLLANVAIQGIPLLPEASDELMELSMNSHNKEDTNSNEKNGNLGIRTKRAPPKGYVYTQFCINRPCGLKKIGTRQTSQ